MLNFKCTLLSLFLVVQAPVWAADVYTLDRSNLTIETGKYTGAAVGLSIIPGMGQFYNGDTTWGVLYLLAAVGVIAIDAGLYVSASSELSEVNAPPNVALVLPLLSLASMIHAGISTQETYPVKVE